MYLCLQLSIFKQVELFNIFNISNISNIYNFYKINLNILILILNTILLQRNEYSENSMQI